MSEQLKETQTSHENTPNCADNDTLCCVCGHATWDHWLLREGCDHCNCKRVVRAGAARSITTPPTIPFTCCECGGTVQDARGSHRTYEISDYLLRIPDGMLIPTCEGCGELYFTAHISAVLESSLIRLALEEQSERFQRMLHCIMSSQAPFTIITPKDIARTCGVGWNEFQRFLSGEELAPTMLLRLLQAFTDSPGTYMRLHYTT